MTPTDHPTWDDLPPAERARAEAIRDALMIGGIGEEQAIPIARAHARGVLGDDDDERSRWPDPLAPDRALTTR